MALHDSEQKLVEQDIEGYLTRHENKELLRFVTVGSVDDGKSTLIGRLLHDTHGIYDDQLQAVQRASKQNGAEIDFSLFTDGLKAEREQGITIDVAYRYFSTPTRKFIIADTPGHVQYTRNMATGASTADLAIILIDARLGVLTQSRRHAFIASLLGIGQLTVCVNKMDLEGYDPEVFQRISSEFRAFTERLGFTGVTFIPVSALCGDNVVERSSKMPWYDGPTVLEHLERVPLPEVGAAEAFRYPVQIVLRPDLTYRAFAGQIAAGRVRPGDRVRILPSRKESRVASVDTFEGSVDEAHAPMSVALRLEDEIDVSRGDLIVHAGSEPEVARRFEAMLVWMSERALDRGKSYLLKHNTQWVRAEVEAVAHAVDLETLSPVSAEHLELNDIGRVTMSCHRPLFVDAYTECRATGCFVLVDSISNNTVAAGMILREAPGLATEDHAAGGARSQVSSAERRERLGQGGKVFWLTGLPASGKTELAYALERLIFDRGGAAVVLDPDDGATRSVGPGGGSPPHAPELARRFADAGMVAIFAFASPLATDREAVRAAVGAERFFEIHVSTPLEVCRSRDHRGTYDAAHGPLSYEAPDRPRATVDLSDQLPEQAAKALLALLGDIRS